MILSQLRYLVAFADEGTVSGAAKSVRASQPGLSRALRALEEELQAPLFARAGRRLRLTPDGQAAVEASRRALAAFDAVKASVSTNRPAPVLRGAVFFPLAGVVSETLNMFLRRWPGVQVRTIHAPSSHAVADIVASGEADLGFGEAIDLPDGLGFTPYGDLEVVLISPLGCTLPPVLDVNALATTPLISIADSPHRRRVFDDLLARSGLRARIVLEADDLQAFLSAVRSGIGSALAWRVVCEGLSDVEMRVFSPPSTQTVGYMHPKSPRQEARDCLQMSAIAGRRDGVARGQGA